MRRKDKEGWVSCDRVGSVRQGLASRIRRRLSCALQALRSPLGPSPDAAYDSLFPPKCLRRGKERIDRKSHRLFLPGLWSDVPSMQAFLEQHRKQDSRCLHLTFEVSGQAGYWYDHLMDRVDKQLAALTEYLDGYLAQQAGWKVLRSIPGVGPRTAEAVLAHTDDVKRFAGGKEYGAYFGLTPKLDESGESRRVGHISKQGPVVRGPLVESAWRAIRSSSVFRSLRLYEV